MGVRIESQFLESPFFGLLQQINQVYQMVAALTTVTWWFGYGLRLRHVVSSTSRRRRPNRRKLARVITLLVVLPYRRVRLPRGLWHRRESSTSSSVRRTGHISFITHFA